MFIDAHVHLRDFEESHKETIEHGLRVAEDSGLSAIFDMPNTKPATIDIRTVEKRLRIAKDCNSPVFYGLYVGLTADPKQIKQAVELYNLYFPKPGDKFGIIGLKMFAGKSVGDLSVVAPEDQKRVYQTLADADYEGVLAVHCEKESFMKPDFWNPQCPRTHSLARPEDSEYQSVSDQIVFAKIGAYKGHLHICHVSTPDSVSLVKLAQKHDEKVSCGVTPHHLLLDNEVMNGENGILYKVNPPLRAPETRKKLFERFLNGEIDILETDHAPHTPDDKTQKYMSGIPGLASWPDFIELLRDKGATHGFVEDMAYHNVNRIFGTNIPRLDLPVKQGAHLHEYAFDAYAGLK